MRIRDTEEEVSECCGATTSNTDIDICPACLEHCEFIITDES